MFGVVLQRCVFKRPNLYRIIFILAMIMYLSNTSIARPRCWIGVIDQINPPWVSIIGEHDEEAVISLQRVYASAAEGDWVVYWIDDQRLELFRSTQTQAEHRRLKLLSDILLNEPRDMFEHEEWMSGDLKRGQWRRSHKDPSE